MVFMPTESLILGLFIIAAIFLIISAAMNLAKLFAEAAYQRTLCQVFRYNIWLGRIFLVFALAAGVASSFIPV